MTDVRASATSIDVVQRAWRALWEDRPEELAELVHPRATLMPSTRPARSVYFGSGQVMQMLEDVRRALGPFEIVFHDFIEDDDGRVTASGHLMARDDAGRLSRVPITTKFTVEDGLIVHMEEARGCD